MNKVIKQLLILFFLVTILVLPYFVFASTQILDNLKTVAGGKSEEGAYNTDGTATIASIAGTAVSAFLGILGIIFIVLVVYGGYNYMTARGEEEKMNKAIATIQRAVIGLIIVFASYAAWAFIFFNFINK